MNTLKAKQKIEVQMSDPWGKTWNQTVIVVAIKGDNVLLDSGMSVHFSNLV